MVEQLKELLSEMSRKRQGEVICALSTDEAMLVEIMRARAEGRPVEIPVDEEKETLGFIADSPVLNLLTLTEGLERYTALLETAKLDEDEMTKKTGEFLSLPTDRGARIKRLDLVHSTFLKSPDNFDDLSGGITLPDGVELNIINEGVA